MDLFGRKRRQEEREFEAERQKRVKEDQEFVDKYLEALRIATDKSSPKEKLILALGMLATYGRDHVPGYQRIPKPARQLNSSYGFEVVNAAKNINLLINSSDNEIGDAALAALRGLTREFDYSELQQLFSEFRLDVDPRDKMEAAQPSEVQPSTWYKEQQKPDTRAVAESGQQPSEWYKPDQPGEEPSDEVLPEEPGGLKHQPSDWFRNK